jgi:hypothetical protein
MRNFLINNAKVKVIGTRWPLQKLRKGIWENSLLNTIQVFPMFLYLNLTASFHAYLNLILVLFFKKKRPAQLIDLKRKAKMHILGQAGQFTVAGPPSLLVPDAIILGKSSRYLPKHLRKSVFSPWTLKPGKSPPWTFKTIRFTSLAGYKRFCFFLFYLFWANIW